MDYVVFEPGLNYPSNLNVTLFDWPGLHRSVFALPSFLFFQIIDIIFGSFDIVLLVDYNTFFDHLNVLFYAVFNLFDFLKMFVTFIFLIKICLSFIIESLIVLLQNSIVIY